MKMKEIVHRRGRTIPGAPLDAAMILIIIIIIIID